MRLLFLLFLLTGMLPASAQSGVSFETSANGSFRYPDKAIDSFLALSQYNAIVVGETHTVNFEPEFKFLLIKQLNDQHHIRDVFMEIGHSAAWLFNTYLSTGDTALFQNLKIVYSGAQGSYRDFWKRLYQYNQSLPAAERIRIHGVDFERTEVFRVLLALRPADKAIPASLQPAFALLEQYAADTTQNHFSKVFVQQLETVKTSMKQQLQAVLAYYGDHATTVSYILNNNGPHTPATPKRNKSMAENLRQVIAAEHINSFVCFFGAAHTGNATKGSMSCRIRQIDGFRNKVLVMNTVYFNAYSTFSKSVLPCIGDIRGKSSGTLYEQYLKGNCRAVLLKCSDVPDSHLKRSADYVLLARDMP